MSGGFCCYKAWTLVGSVNSFQTAWLLFSWLATLMRLQLTIEPSLASNVCEHALADRYMWFLALTSGVAALSCALIKNYHLFPGRSLIRFPALEEVHSQSVLLIWTLCLQTGLSVGYLSGFSNWTSFPPGIYVLNLHAVALVCLM